jgi:hypothetical protein
MHAPDDSRLFIERLQEEAALQSRLHSQRLLPKQLDSLTSLVGNYPWQVILVVSGLTALILETMT